MFDRLGAVVGLQVTLSGIGARRLAVYQHMVPRLILIGLGTIREIPLGVGHATRVNRYDHTPISVAAMTNQLSRFEERLRLRKANHVGDHGEKKQVQLH